MKNLILVLIILALLNIMPVTLAGNDKTETGHYSDGEFHHEQTYVGWGPACYYGETVKVVYDATNTWTYILKKGDVQETLVQNGTAKIYDMEDNLLDERAFTVMERFFDAGTDVAIRHDYGTSVWYQVSHNPYSPDLEEYQYIWKIPGVYDYRVWNRSGDISWALISGDCELGGTDGWPPIPPHPFNE